jgi:NADPH:quinone reductase-like Zn-dependent oxidoreductase
MSENRTDTMKAVIVREPGGPDALEITEVPVPQPGPGQVRIRVAAAAVNPVDIATRTGALVAGGLVPSREVTGIGWDAAGVVDAVGEGAAGFSVGDRVVGMSDRLDVPLAAQAEYVVLDAQAVALLAEDLDFASAATIPLGGLTAKQALDRLGLEQGQTLLVTGAAGAVGGFAVELAVLRGLRVVATSKPSDEATVRDLGATWFVPRGDRLGEAVRALVPRGVDGALDAAALGAETLDAVRTRGALAALVGGAEPPPLRGIRVFNHWIYADGGELAELVDLARTGSLTLRMADTLPLEKVAEAHRRLEAGGLRGKLVLEP